MGPLQGIRVVELSTGIAGPFAGMLLADYGADVVKVEPPTGDPARGLPGFAVWNRGKQSVALDLGAATGRARLDAMLAAADVCITPHLAAIGDAARSNPGLVVLFMPPYTAEGAPWAGGEERPELLSAVTGLARRQSSFDGGPIEMVYPLALYQQGVWAAACGVAALIERQRSGLGQVVTVSGVHAALATSPGGFALDPEHPPLPTNVGPGGRNPPYSTFKCGDGKWLFMAALTPKFQTNAFKVLGVSDILSDPRINGVPNRMILADNREWVRQRLRAAFLTRGRDEWLDLLEEGDCPAGPLQTRDEWLDHPQVTANGLRAEVDDPERGRVQMSGLCVHLSRTPGYVHAPAPRLGEHSETAGRWSPRPAPAASCTRATAAGQGPLAGFRVLDLGTILAGPYAGSLLAGLGADVIKVESPAGDAFRETGFVYNRGMRGLAIDLSDEAGQRAFHALARTADAVMDNSRLGVAGRLKFDYKTLEALHPGIVTLSIAGFGEGGPFAHKPAFDPVLQAMSGMMTAQGGDSDPSFFTIPVNDVAAAVTAVLAVCLGLYHRGESGHGQRTTTSLVASSLTMQSGELARFKDRPPALVGGRDFAGACPARRYHRTADGWIRVEAPSTEALADALGCDEGAIAACLSSLGTRDALATLGAHGVPAVAARQPLEVAEDDSIVAEEPFLERRFPDGRRYLVPNRFAQFSRTQHPSIGDAPGVGEHSRQVLREAGLDEGEIDGLVGRRVVIEGGPLVIQQLVNYR
ncbi:MAG: CoA transferase [Chloroflexota bacterium]